MNKAEDFKLLKIQTVILRVLIHCDGCKQNVKKLLQKIEGVYTVSIDAELQKVTVSGNVDSATLIKKLSKSGKHVELWSNQKSKNNHNSQTSKVNHQQQTKNQNNNNNNKGQPQANQASLLQGLQAFKNQHSNNANNNKSKLESFTFTDNDDELSEDDDEYCTDEEDDDDEVQFLNTLKNASNVKKATPNQMGINATNVPNPANANINGMMNRLSLQNPQMANYMMMNNNLKALPNSNGNMNPGMMVNLQALQQPQPQPQVAYNRVSQVPAQTGFYYPYPSYYGTNPCYHNQENVEYQGRSCYEEDDAGSSCSVM